MIWLAKETLHVARSLLAVLGLLLLAACVGGQGDGMPRAGAGPDGWPGARPEPRIVDGGRRLQCVAYARARSGLPIRGDAWTWWRAAESRYGRSREPAVGTVLVFERTRRLSRGHLAVVTRVLSRREIVVDHANWLNAGRIHLDTPVVDVSPENDWSRVRVWYTPGGTFGSHVYAAAGFIHPPQPRIARGGP